MMLWIIIIAIVGLAMWGIFRWVDHRNSVDVYTPQDDQDHQDKLKPYFCREVVERKVRALFPDQDHAQILQLLDDNTPDFWGLERTAQVNEALCKVLCHNLCVVIQSM